MTTNNHPAHGPVSLDRLHQISEILSKAAAQSDGGNLGYAMVDAVKVIDSAIAAFDAEPVAWQWEYRDKRHVTNDQRRAKIVAEDGEVLVQPLYTAPPAPVDRNPLREFAMEYIESWDLGMAGDSSLLASARKAIADSEILQPATVVPDEIEPDDGNTFDYVDGWNACRAAMLQGTDGKPELTVWYGSMPETNGKTNWTAMLHRKGQHQWEGITIDRSEYPDRVRYEADRMRHLIGELPDEPDILSYDADAHSGYVKPGNSPASPDGWQLVPKKITLEMECAISRADSYEIGWQWALAAAPKYEVKS